MIGENSSTGINRSGLVRNNEETNHFLGVTNERNKVNCFDACDLETEKHISPNGSCVVLKKLKSNLECPVCLVVPKSGPIYQCRNGHLLCKECHAKINRCPLCNIRLEKLRNLLSEQLVALIYPDYIFSIDRSVGLQEVIWQGQLEWKENPQRHRQIMENYMSNQTEKFCANVNIKASIKHGTPQVVSANWPSSLVMQLMPIRIIRRVGKEFFSDSMTVMFDLPAEEHFNLLKSHLDNTGLSGVVHFMADRDCEIKVLILLYSSERKVFVGFIPGDQILFIQRIRDEIQRENSIQQLDSSHQIT